jgi:serine phosphatase RsbU (regulator of sigma subunit)
MSSYSKKNQHAYQFFQEINEGIWHCELEKPISIHKSMEEHISHIIQFCKFTEVNESFVKMYSLESKEEVLNLSILHFLSMQESEGREILEKFIQNKYQLIDEVTIELDKFGNTHYYLNTVVGIVENEELVHVWGTQKDITVLKNSETKIIQLLRFEKAIGEVSRRILYLKPDNKNEIIEKALQRLGEFTSVDRVYIFEVNIERTIVSNTYEWCADGIESVKEDLQDMDIQGSIVRSWQLLSEQDFFIAHLDSPDMDLSEAEISMMESQSILSILLVGLWENGDLVGFVGFDSVRFKKTWKEEDIELLRIFSDILSISLGNLRYQIELIHKEESLVEFYRRIEDDLELAKITQNNLISTDFPKSSLYKLTSFFQPFGKVGGDVISYLEHDDYIDILFGDVSGHGISSAMISGMVILSFKNSSRLHETPSEILSAMNRDLKEIVLNHHISAVSARYYHKTRKLIYSYAGHPPLALLRDGKVMELDGMNTPLLTVDNIKYFENDIILHKKDRIFFYSDGCYEVFNEQKEFMGLGRFLAIVNGENVEQNTLDFIERVIEKVLEFCSDDIRDDLSVLVLDVFE